jgi:hypothetical protein
MADHGVLLKKACASIDVGSYNRFAMAGSAVDLDNGNVFRLDTENTAGTSGYSEVWDVTAPSLSGSTLGCLWMASQDGVNLLVDGVLEYRGLSDDPRKFYNVGAKVFTAFKPQIGDIIEISADAISNTRTAETFLNAADAAYEMAWGSTQTDSDLSFKLITATNFFSIGTGAMDTQRFTAFKLVCIAN